jgi:hypothetical protein
MSHSTKFYHSIYSTVIPVGHTAVIAQVAMKG